jgi:hypothetical protein
MARAGAGLSGRPGRFGRTVAAGTGGGWILACAAGTAAVNREGGATEGRCLEHGGKRAWTAATAAWTWGAVRGAVAGAGGSFGCMVRAIAAWTCAACGLGIWGAGDSRVEGRLAITDPMPSRVYIKTQTQEILSLLGEAARAPAGLPQARPMRRRPARLLFPSPDLFGSRAPAPAGSSLFFARASILTGQPSPTGNPPSSVLGSRCPMRTLPPSNLGSRCPVRTCLPSTLDAAPSILGDGCPPRPRPPFSPGSRCPVTADLRPFWAMTAP